MPFARRGGIAADESITTARVLHRRHFRVYAVSTALAVAGHSSGIAASAVPAWVRISTASRAAATAEAAQITNNSW